MIGEQMLDREDRPALVSFEIKSIEDKLASEKEGYTVYKNIEYAHVTPPYSKDRLVFTVDTWVRNCKDKLRNGRIPQKFYDYWMSSLDAWRKGLEPPVDGTDIRNWGLITPAQISACRAANIRTVEDLAMANDEGLRRLGMGGVHLKNKAAAFVKAQKDHGPLVQENAKLKREIEQLQGTVKSLEGKIDRIINESNGRPLMEDRDDGNSHMSISPSDILDVSHETKTPAELYEEKFGHAPHHKMKEETILRKISQ